MSVSYARVLPGGRVHHVVRAGALATVCGLALGPGLAVWPSNLNSRVDHAPTCGTCRAGVA